MASKEKLPGGVVLKGRQSCLVCESDLTPFDGEELPEMAGYGHSPKWRPLLGGEVGDLDGGVAVVGEGEGFVAPVAAALAAEEEGCRR